MDQWIQYKLGKQYLLKENYTTWESNPGPTPIRGGPVTIIASVGLKKLVANVANESASVKNYQDGQEITHSIWRLWSDRSRARQYKSQLVTFFGFFRPDTQGFSRYFSEVQWGTKLVDSRGRYSYKFNF